MENNPQEILNMKLADPSRELSPTESISLISHCAQLGEQNAAPATGKKVLMVLGNTGAGKSTTVNYLMGCEMKAALNEFEEAIIIVDPESHVREIMPIGHDSRSHTFMPKTVLDPSNTNGSTATALDLEITEAQKSTSPMPSTPEGSCNRQPA
jgi:hypothetical protein